MATLGMIVLGIALLSGIPFAAVWAVNTVFDTQLAITSFKVWVAVVILLALIGGPR